MRRRIFWAILGVAGAVLFLVALVSAGTSRSNARDRITAQLETTAEVVASEIADRPLARAAVRAETADAARIILNRNDRPERLVDGTVIQFGLITESFVVVADSVQELDLDLNALRSEEIVRLDQRISDEQWIAVVRPVSIDDSASRVLIIAARPLGRVQVRAVARDLAVPLLVAAIMAAIGARIVSGSIVKRLDTLRDATRKLRARDWSARADVAGSDEVAEVAATFNDLAAFLEETSSRERAFLMSVSHDLRTPLTTVAGYAELLANDDNSETSRIGSVLERETRRLRRLVEDVMLLAQLEARQFSVRPELVDLGAHIRQICDGFMAKAIDARIDLVVATETTGLLLTDPDRLDQIVGNLLENAIRHTPERGRIDVSADFQGSEVVLTVRDSGPGVAADEVDRLFERFYVARHQERPEGSGLGLSIVRQLVAMLGGTVHARLPDEGGLIIEVRLEGVQGSQ